MKSIVMGVMMTVSAVLLADVWYWHGPIADPDRKGDWMEEDMWLDAATGTLVTWQEGDTHDVIFNPSRVGGTGWFNRIGVPPEGVTPDSVLVINAAQCAFRVDSTSGSTPGRIFTSVFTAKDKAVVSFWDATTLQTPALVIDGTTGGNITYDLGGLATLSLCETLVLTNATVRARGGTLTSDIHVTGTSMVTQANYGGDLWWILAGAMTLYPGALFMQTEDSSNYQWRTYEIAGDITLLGDATIQGGTRDANRTFISGAVTGAYTLTLRVIGTNPNGGMVVRNGAWQDVAGLIKTGTGILTIQTANLLGDVADVQQKKNALFSIQEGQVRLSAPQVAKTIQLGSDIITVPGTYATAVLDPGNLYFTADSTGTITIPPPAGTVLMLR